MVRKLESFIKKFYLILIFIFLYLPIVTLMVFSFNDSKSMGKWNGFTLNWYIEWFQNDSIMSALKYTLLHHLRLRQFLQPVPFSFALFM